MGRIDLRAKLSRRETEIAELLAWGAAKKEVADRLSISPRTVENTARNIYQKIGIQKATELCVYWFISRLGVSPDKDPLKRVFIAMILLAAIGAYELTATKQGQDLYRQPPTRTVRTVRARRNEANLFDNDFLG